MQMFFLWLNIVDVDKLACGHQIKEGIYQHGGVAAPSVDRLVVGSQFLCGASMSE